MSMTVVLDDFSIPEKGDVELNVNRAFRINITAQDAQKRVNHWLFTQVSCMMMADTPTLMFGSKVAWRVPAIFCATHIGPVGPAGMIDVDVYTGEMDDTERQKVALLREAKALAEKMPPYRERKELPDGHIVKNIERTELPPEGNPADIITATRRNQLVRS